MLAPTSDTMAAMAQVADNRAHSWRLVSEIVAGPTEDLVSQLRDGRFIERLLSLGEWMGEGNPFELQVPSLRAVVGRARRHSVESDLSVLRADWERIFDGASADFAEGYLRAAGICDHEAEAWRSGEHERAKQLRLDQLDELNTTLEPMTEWCQSLHDDCRIFTGSALARVVAAHLSVESGRDVVSVVVGRR